MPTFDADGNPVYAEWTSAMKDALHANFKVIDPNGAGADRSKLRLFYPMLGWNDIQKGVDALKADGRLTVKMLYVNGNPVEAFVWKEAAV